MIGEALLFVVGLGGTVLLGAPVASALAQPHRWRSLFGERREERVDRGRDVTRPFKPLDLGPDPVRWPSERPWPVSTTLPQPDWPSKAWNDEHFGSHWRSGAIAAVQDLGFHAMAARRGGFEPAPAPARAPTPAPAKRPAPPPPLDSEDEAWFDEPAAILRPKPAPAPRRREEPRREESRRRAAEPARKAARAQPQPAPTPRKGQPPERSELEQLIATVGLAGTVQAIMDRTGWEFREAAHYLAKIRNSR